MENEPGREGGETGLKERVTMAIQRGDCEALVAALADLNTALTGNLAADFAPQNAGQLRADLTAFLERAKHGSSDHVVYLGDGGLSRVILEVDGADVICDFTSNMTDTTAKERWDALS